MFGNKKGIAALILAKAKPAEEAPESEEGEHDGEGLRIACEDLLKAIESKDVDGMMSAFSAAFEISDSMPHEEGEHSEEEPEQFADGGKVTVREYARGGKIAPLNLAERIASKYAKGGEANLPLRSKTKDASDDAMVASERAAKISRMVERTDAPGDPSTAHPEAARAHEHAAKMWRDAGNESRAAHHEERAKKHRQIAFGND